MFPGENTFQNTCNAKYLQTKWNFVSSSELRLGTFLLVKFHTDSEQTYNVNIVKSHLVNGLNGSSTFNILSSPGNSVVIHTRMNSDLEIFSFQ
jgi:hypothetical protein